MFVALCDHMLQVCHAAGSVELLNDAIGIRASVQQLRGRFKTVLSAPRDEAARSAFYGSTKAFMRQTIAAMEQPMDESDADNVVRTRMDCDRVCRDVLDSGFVSAPWQSQHTATVPSTTSPESNHSDGPDNQPERYEYTRRDHISFEGSRPSRAIA